MTHAVANASPKLDSTMPPICEADHDIESILDICHVASAMNHGSCGAATRCSCKYGPMAESDLVRVCDGLLRSSDERHLGS